MMLLKYKINDYEKICINTINLALKHLIRQEFLIYFPVIVDRRL